MSPEEAQAFDLRDGDVVSLRVEGPRPATLDGFIVRSGAAHRLEAHIDTDEANACALRDGQLCRVIRREGADVCAPGNTGLAAALGGMLLGGTPIQAAAQSPIPCPAQSEPIGRDAMLDLSGEARRLITEDDVRRAAQRGYRIIRYAPDAILTPLARDIAAEKRIELASAVH